MTNEDTNSSSVSRLLTHSLVSRFFFASLIILPLFIILSGTLLLNTFQHSQINAAEEKLQTQLYLLLSVTEIEAQQVILPDALTEPRFNQQGSGLYAFIYDDSGKELWRTPSALMLNLDFFKHGGNFTANNRVFTQIDTINRYSTLNHLSYDVEWINENNSTQLLRFIVMSDAAPLAAEINSYRKRLWQWLGTMGVLLILSQLVIMRWGLRPLKHLSKQLNQLQNNDIQQLDNNYPLEVQPVINNFNSILNQEKQQRERYRNTMADLAHSLKTPLAVIQSQLTDANGNESANKNYLMGEQVDRINQIISHQLQRAVIRVNQSGINKNTDKIKIKHVIDRLIKILDKVYQEKNIAFTNLADDDSYFFGEEADLLEVLGNLLDNACKYGNSSVTITAENREGSVNVCISDNGPGIDSELNHIILQRGARADTAQPGQGIGLSVAVDIISSYGGGIDVNKNNLAPHLSGACFCVNFPTY